MALKTTGRCGYELLYLFGKIELTDHMFANAEKFLLQCLSSNEKLKYYDELRNEVCHQKQHRKPISSCIRLHIRRAYLQCYFWRHVPFVNDITINPT